MRSWNCSGSGTKPRSTFLGKLTRRISVNRCLAQHAEKRRNPDVDLSLSELADCIPGRDDLDRHMEGLEIGHAISDYLRTLKPLNRQVFISRYFYSFSIREISARFQISTPKTKSMLLRARRGLKAYLEQEGIPV